MSTNTLVERVLDSMSAGPCAGAAGSGGVWLERRRGEDTLGGKARGSIRTRSGRAFVDQVILQSVFSERREVTGGFFIKK